MDETYQYRLFGASQVGRKHVENQDRIVQRLLSDKSGQIIGALIAVVDGVSSSACGASLARWLADEHLSRDPIADDPEAALVPAIRQYLARLHREFKTEFEEFEPFFKSGASISLAVLRAAEACLFWLGDSPVFVSCHRQGRIETRQISRPHKVDHRIRCFTGPSEPKFDNAVLLLERGDIITIMSDGAIHEATMLNEFYEREGFSDRLCQDVLDFAIPQGQSDDTSIVACRLD